MVHIAVVAVSLGLSSSERSATAQAPDRDKTLEVLLRSHFHKYIDIRIYISAHACIFDSAKAPRHVFTIRYDAIHIYTYVHAA